ncbi:MAG: hypothetical protein GY788_21100 [bacterium]|nr:hypothetical protein [bacterium]
MSRVVVSTFEPTDARDATVLNAQYDAIEAQTTALDASNFREEGLDGRAFEANIQGERWWSIVNDPNINVVSGLHAVNWTNLDIGQGMTVDMLVAAGSMSRTSVPVGGYGRIRLKLQISSDNANGAGLLVAAVKPQIEFRLVTVNGGTTEIPGSHRIYHGDTTAGTTGADICVASMGVITSQLVLTHIIAQVRGTAGTNFTVSYASLAGHIFKRVEAI